MRHLTLFLVHSFHLISIVYGGATNWTKPNGFSPSFTDTYTVGEHIILSWLKLNDSINDLWLTRYDPTFDDFAVRLDVSRNVSIAGSFEWTIAVNTTEVTQDTRFILQFLPAGAAYDATDLPQLPSPAFNLITVNQQTPPNGTVGAPSVTPSSTSASATNTSPSTDTSEPLSTSSSTTTTSNNDNTIYLSAATKAGLSIGASIFVICSFVGLIFAIGAYRRRRPSNNHDRTSKSSSSTSSSSTNSRDEEKSPGPHEAPGDRRHPVELTSKESAIHELNGSKDTVVYESDSSTIHEIGVTTTKIPGVHELPA